MKLYLKLLSGFLLLPALFLVLSGCKEPMPERFEETRSMMDTFVSLVIYTSHEKAPEAINAAFTRIEEIEQIATTWDSRGEAFRLNETGYLENASEELVELLRLSLEYNDISGGSFDITVQPLLDLWQFNPEAETQFWKLDKETQIEEINEAMKLVGSDRITISGRSVSLKEGTKITLGGIAKGYAADEALEVLAKMGIRYALVNAGGDIRTLGSKPDGTPWEIALANPDDTTQKLAAFRVSGMSVTTSGNYERYFNPDKTAHHILNPKTGFSAGECISVTVITENGARADALATGVFVLGPVEGMKLVESLDDVEAMIVDTDRNIYKSSGLSRYMVNE